MAVLLVTVFLSDCPFVFLVVAILTTWHRTPHRVNSRSADTGAGRKRGAGRSAGKGMFFHFCNESALAGTFASTFRFLYLAVRVVNLWISLPVSMSHLSTLPRFLRTRLAEPRPWFITEFRLGTLPRVPSHRLLESYFLCFFLQKGYAYQTTWSRPLGLA